MTDIRTRPFCATPMGGNGVSKQPLAGIPRDELLAEIAGLRSENVQLQERHERQQAELHAQGQELIALRRDVERAQGRLEDLERDVEMVAREAARLGTEERR